MIKVGLMWFLRFHRECVLVNSKNETFSSKSCWGRTFLILCPHIEFSITHIARICNMEIFSLLLAKIFSFHLFQLFIPIDILFMKQWYLLFVWHHMNFRFYKQTDFVEFWPSKKGFINRLCLSAIYLIHVHICRYKEKVPFHL